MTTDAATTDATPRVKVEFFEAQPNKMFPEQITALLRFARPAAPIICAACGRRSRKLWTMLCAFRCGVAPAGSFTMEVGQERSALTLVCSLHPINPTAPILAAMEGDLEIDAPAAPTMPEILDGDFGMQDPDEDDEDEDEG